MHVHIHVHIHTQYYSTMIHLVVCIDHGFHSDACHPYIAGYLSFLRVYGVNRLFELKANPCVMLTQYVQNSTFDSKSSIKLVLEPGEHYLNIDFVIKNTCPVTYL